MTDDATGDSMTDNFRPAGGFLPGDADAVETADALRLAEILERVEAGDAPDLDPTEDPSLADLLVTATRARLELGTVGDERAFRSFHTRSRAAILHTLEPRSKVVPFTRRARVLAPFAAVAAAAAIAISALGPSTLPNPLSGSPSGRGATDASVTNLTPRTTVEELYRLAIAIADLQERAQSGQSVPAPLLRAVSEGTARVANLIEQSPERVSKETVTTYIQAAQNGQHVLNTLSTLTVDQDAQGALAAAQRAARDGVVVAARFLNPAGTPSGTVQATGPTNPSAATTASPVTTGSPATPGSAPAASAPATTGARPPAGTPSGDGAATPKLAPATEPPSDITR